MCLADSCAKQDLAWTALSRRHLLRRDPPLSAGQLQAEQAILTMTTYKLWAQDNGITGMAAVRNMREWTIEDLRESPCRLCRSLSDTAAWACDRGRTVALFAGSAPSMWTV
jgi:hypothetical protein